MAIAAPRGMAARACRSTACSPLVNRLIEGLWSPWGCLDLLTARSVLFWRVDGRASAHCAQRATFVQIAAHRLCRR
jgi:hypothetical protein